MTETLTSVRRRSAQGRPDDGRRLRQLLTVAGLCGLIVVISVLSAYVWSTTQPTVYAARGEVAYEVSPENEPQAQRLLQTQRVLLSSRERLRPLAEQASRSVAEFEEALSVSLIDESQVIEIHLTGEEPDVTRRLVQTLMEQYVEQVGATATRSVDEQRAVVQEQIENVQVQLEETRAQLQALEAERLERIEAARQEALQLAQDEDSQAPMRLFDPDVVAPVTAEMELLENEARELQRELAGLRARGTELEVTALDERSIAQTDAAAATIVTPAYVLEDLVAPRPVQTAAAGLLVGLLLAAGAAVAILRLHS